MEVEKEYSILYWTAIF